MCAIQTIEQNLLSMTTSLLKLKVIRALFHCASYVVSKEEEVVVSKALELI